ncbi:MULTISPECIES: Ig-like domain repeat protein [unclassified Nocardioides]|uniref:Ig-like domain repeat protein n=1 Tax=unclassified Nocardioides TaxID=2615069 RepID=UPI003618118A
MNLISRTATAFVAALALSVPTAAITTAANATPGATSQVEQHTQVAAKAKKKLKIKLSKGKKGYSHYGQPGVKVTATVAKGKKKAKGKVTFLLNGTAVRTAKLKKGKASYQLASTTAPGSYKVTAKYKSKKKTTSVRVYNSAIAVSATSLTYSQAAIDAYQYSGTAITGTVNFKDAVATKGWVDIYKDGNIKGGSSSPDYCCMAPVGTNGAFEFSHYEFMSDLEKRGITPGTTVTYYAYYTDDAGFDDYIYSAPITVTLVP